MPSSSPLDPKAAVFTAKTSTNSSKQLNPKAPAPTIIWHKEFISNSKHPTSAIVSALEITTNNRSCQTHSMTEPEPKAIEIFSLPIELRLDIYKRVLDEDYEIYETGLPALLRTRLQITREYYQLCTLRIVLVRESRVDTTRYKLPDLEFREFGKSLLRTERDEIERHRVWEHWEKIMDFGMSIPRHDVFVHVRVEAWCKHAAMYPEKALRSHGRCRDCRVRRLERIPWTCGGYQSFLAITLLYVPITGLLFGFIYFLKTKMPKDEDGHRWRCLVH
ncbi:hypothetical protein E4T39_07547 [Aureobasidium subglaciale]|nr:hypothetical protein E4T39_07547 [Aureobasidium subglaciale]